MSIFGDLESSTEHAKKLSYRLQEVGNLLYGIEENSSIEYVLDTLKDAIEIVEDVEAELY